MRKIIIFFLLLAPITVLAQGQAIQGTVTAFNKFPLDNVVVKSLKTQTQVLTNERGEFLIDVTKNDVLKFEAQGFEPHQLKVRKPKTIKPVRTNLVYANRPNDYDVAIGYGHIRREDLTYAIDHLLIGTNDHSRFNNIYDLIRSRVAGVAVSQERGQKIFVIRGISSINSSNAALLVVDGVVVSNLDFINLHDIDTIQVLKDSSAAIYGSRGANGVIMVTTKRGGGRVR
jgi:TonB-dependent SusC/RagA subfamily outer membrane receptor